MRFVGHVYCFTKIMISKCLLVVAVWRRCSVEEGVVSVQDGSCSEEGWVCVGMRGRKVDACWRVHGS